MAPLVLGLGPGVDRHPERLANHDAPFLPYGAFRSPSHLTTQRPSAGKPGAGRSGAPSQPAAIIATA